MRGCTRARTHMCTHTQARVPGAGKVPGQQAHSFCLCPESGHTRSSAGSGATRDNTTGRGRPGQALALRLLCSVSSALYQGGLSSSVSWERAGQQVVDPSPSHPRPPSPHGLDTVTTQSGPHLCFRSPPSADPSPLCSSGLCPNSQGTRGRSFPTFKIKETEKDTRHSRNTSTTRDGTRDKRRSEETNKQKKNAENLSPKTGREMKDNTPWKRDRAFLKGDV